MRTFIMEDLMETDIKVCASREMVFQKIFWNVFHGFFSRCCFCGLSRT